MDTSPDKKAVKPLKYKDNMPYRINRQIIDINHLKFDPDCDLFALSVDLQELLDKHTKKTEAVRRKRETREKSASA